MKCPICEAKDNKDCLCESKLTYFEKLLIMKLGDIGYQLREIESRLEDIWQKEG